MEYSKLGYEILNDIAINTYEGEPFTGIAYEKRKDGSIKTEDSFKDGLFDGNCKTWYATGQIESETTCIKGVAHGKKTTWYANGQIKSEEEIKYGITIREQKWNEQGFKISDKKIDKESQSYKLATKIESRIKQGK